MSSCNLYEFVVTNGIKTENGFIDYLKTPNRIGFVEVESFDGTKYEVSIKDNVLIAINKENEFNFVRIPLNKDDIGMFLYIHDKSYRIIDNAGNILQIIMMQKLNRNEIKSLLKDVPKEDRFILILTLGNMIINSITSTDMKSKSFKDLFTDNVLLSILNSIIDITKEMIEEL